MVMVLPAGRCATLVVVGVLALGPVQAVKLRATRKHSSRDIGGDPGKLMIGDSKDNWFPIGETLYEQHMEKAAPDDFIKQAKQAGMTISTMFKPTLCDQMPKSHSGDTISVKYTGWLWEDGAKSEQFDSNESPGRVPFEFTLGKGVVLKGWDAGLLEMCEGQKRQLIIPPNMGYGAQGFPGSIPPFATLMFEITLVKFDSGVDYEKQVAEAGYLAMEGAYLAAKKKNHLLKGRGFGKKLDGYKATGVDVEPSFGIADPKEQPLQLRKEFRSKYRDDEDERREVERFASKLIGAKTSPIEPKFADALKDNGAEGGGKWVARQRKEWLLKHPGKATPAEMKLEKVTVQNEEVKSATAEMVKLRALASKQKDWNAKHSVVERVSGVTRLP